MDTAPIFPAALNEKSNCSGQGFRILSVIVSESDTIPFSLHPDEDLSLRVIGRATLADLGAGLQIGHSPASQT